VGERCSNYNKAIESKGTQPGTAVHERQDKKWLTLRGVCVDIRKKKSVSNGRLHHVFEKKTTSGGGPL